MKAGKVMAFITCILLVFCVPVAGCICFGPGTAGPTPTPSAGTPVPGPTASPGPEPAASLTGWGTDRDVYARNATATGWVDVTNTGSVPIDQVDFAIVIKRTILFVPVEKAFSHSATSLDIRPGETKKVQFSLTIPAEYQGISTAGDYQFVVTASLAGKEVGSYTKGITVI
jgi:hypothetical protein